MQKFLEWIGGRKFFLALVGLVIGIVVDMYTARGLSENLMIFMISIVGTFGVSNVASKAANRNQVKPEPGISHADVVAVAEEYRQSAEQQIAALQQQLTQVTAIVQQLAVRNNDSQQG